MFWKSLNNYYFKGDLKHLKCIKLQGICKKYLLKNDTNCVYKTSGSQVANKCNQMMLVLVLPFLHNLFQFPPVCHFFCFTFALFSLKCDHKNSMWFGASQHCIESQRLWERQTVNLVKEMEIGGEERDSQALASLGGNCNFCALTFAFCHGFIYTWTKNCGTRLTSASTHGRLRRTHTQALYGIPEKVKIFLSLKLSSTTIEIEIILLKIYSLEDCKI